MEALVIVADEPPLAGTMIKIAMDRKAIRT
jgi:hypothetical protein